MPKGVSQKENDTRGKSETLRMKNDRNGRSWINVIDYSSPLNSFKYVCLSKAKIIAFKKHCLDWIFNVCRSKTFDNS